MPAPPRRRPRPIKRVVIVARVSTEGQGDNTSHDVQTRACRDLCARKGWDVVAELEEMESGMLNLSRTQTQQAIEMIEAGVADAVLFYDVSRYSRDGEFQQSLLKRIIRAGGQLQIAMFLLDYEDSGELTPESAMMFNTLCGGASFEKRMIARRMKSGKQRRADEGRQMVRATSPWGWKIVRKNDIIRGEYPVNEAGYYYPVPEELAMIHKLIHEPFLAGQSLNQIARSLNVSGTPTRRGNEWSASTIKDILRNPIYCGRPAWKRTVSYQDDGRTAEGFSPHVRNRTQIQDWQFLDTPEVKAHFQRPDIAPYLIPETDWWRIQSMIAENRIARMGDPKTRYALARLAQCPLCSENLKGRTQNVAMKNGGTPWRTYVCRFSPYIRTPTIKPCAGPAWHAVTLESVVFDALEWFVSNPHVSRTIQEFKSKITPVLIEDETNSMAGRLNEIEAREEATISAKIEAMILKQDVATYNQILSRLAAEKQVLLIQHPKKVTSSLSGPDMERFSILIHDLRTVSSATQNDVLRNIVDHIEIDPTPHRGFNLRVEPREVRTVLAGEGIVAIIKSKKAKSGYSHSLTLKT